MTQIKTVYSVANKLSYEILKHQKYGYFVNSVYFDNTTQKYEITLLKEG